MPRPRPASRSAPRPAPRAACPVCDRDLGLSRGGRLPPHLLPKGHRLRESALDVWCPGAHQIPPAPPPDPAGPGETAVAAAARLILHHRGWPADRARAGRDTQCNCGWMGTRRDHATHLAEQVLTVVAATAAAPDDGAPS